ncbi:hypothetical protein BESB_031560 [Besnoitia besnoiti]|uniref:Transmembrane protein n=1 Tax=Besnoitia besnoiti TaxID=94643 RepID=A0A2A9M5I3_BESBE|nr:uncharacterized protein BESB_031560 [Besnoitia besnoiti]PFH30680.1 hypothetical protein BESB_031560 [Besnoitia besnoiti]
MCYNNTVDLEGLCLPDPSSLVLFMTIMLSALSIVVSSVYLKKPTFVYKLYEYHDIHFGSRLLNVSLYGIHGSDSCWPGTCLVTG